MASWAKASRAWGLAIALVVAPPNGASAQGRSATVATDKAAALAEAEALSAQAMRLHEGGQYAQATPLAERALALREGALGREHPDVTPALSQVAALYREQGAYAKAGLLLQRALRIVERALGPGHPDTAVPLNNLAVLYESQGAYAKAEPLLQRALRIREKELGPEHPDTATTLNNLAELYREQGTHAKAEPLFERALRMREKVLGPEHPSTATSLNNLAQVYLAQGADEKAEPLYLRALAIHEKALGPEHPSTATSLNNLAGLYQQQGAYKKAEPLLRRALRIREKVLGPEHPSTAIALNNLAGLHEMRAAYAEAEPLYERVVRINERALGPEHPRTATALGNLARLYRERGAYGKAELLFKRALRIDEKALGRTHPDTFMGLHHLALLYQAQARARHAVDYASRAEALRERYLGTELATLTEERKRLLLGTLRGDLEWTASFYVHDAPDGDDDQALQLALTTALRRKGRVLDEMAGARAALRRNLSPRLAGELDEFVAKQAELVAFRDAARPEQAEALRALADEVDRRESELSRKIATFRAQANPVTVRQVQAALPEDAALVEFVRYHRFDPKARSNHWKEARYVAYVLRRHGLPQGVWLGKAGPIEEAVRAARYALTAHTADEASRPRVSVDDARRALRRLDKLVLAPVRRVLSRQPPPSLAPDGTPDTIPFNGGQEPQHLLLAPDGALHLVPFEALVDEQEEYLVERTLVTYLGSGRDVLRLRERMSPRSGPLVLAAPDYGPGAEPFAPLRGAAAEAEAVQALFPSADMFYGSRATREALLNAHGPRFALLATHGFLQRPDLPTRPVSPRLPPPAVDRGTSLQRPPSEDDSNPELALERVGLALAGANSRPDAIVNGRDLAGLDLGGTRVVVLSACETGLGQFQDGEGVYGLRRALAIAGAESQVVSLWGVNDQATGELMGAYFQALRDGVGRSESLRQSKLRLLEQDRYKHPYYWAAFVSAGDWRPLDGGAAPPPRLACGCRAVGTDRLSRAQGLLAALALTLMAVARRGRRPRPTERAPSAAGGPGERETATSPAAGARGATHSTPERP